LRILIVFSIFILLQVHAVACDLAKPEQVQGVISKASQCRDLVRIAVALVIVAHSNFFSQMSQVQSEVGAIDVVMCAI
jgi:hypothetical protein